MNRPAGRENERKTCTSIFQRPNWRNRRARCCKEMQEQGLYGLLIFRQESMYYLTGYDTFGYVFFQCLYLGADGRMTLLTPRARSAAGRTHLGH